MLQDFHNQKLIQDKTGLKSDSYQLSFQKVKARPAPGDAIGESHVTAKSSNNSASNGTSSNTTISGVTTSSLKVNNSSVKSPASVHIDNINIPADGENLEHGGLMKVGDTQMKANYLEPVISSI